MADTAISSGTFDIGMEGFSTTIAWNESAAQMKAKLEALSTIHTVNVEVEDVKDSAGVATGEKIWTVAFTHMTHERVQGAGNIQRMTASNYSSLNGTNAKVEVFEEIVGTNPLEYSITGLTAGVKYYARVSAYNAVGFGPLTNVVENFPRSQPDAPSAVSVTVIDQNHLKANLEAPFTTADPQSRTTLLSSTRTTRARVRSPFRRCRVTWRSRKSKPLPLLTTSMVSSVSRSRAQLLKIFRMMHRIQSSSRS